MTQNNKIDYVLWDYNDIFSISIIVIHKTRNDSLKSRRTNKHVIKIAEYDHG